ncbi:glycosyltransferase [Erythrobacter gaetbuli]|uniref:Glycosyltransferase n=1 Tax=Qipengyuania gaetbuli TaxID=266952 RepID=A0A844Y0I0_9SPHN|nr:glycosyltransferase family 4 protein [Qipengyuania gaetbuli]MXO50658.1 glycosyltransferase [Qipengyuania gaetbuli]
MKIVLLNSLYPPSTVGGAERSVEVLAKGLTEAGCNITVICLTDGDDISEVKDDVKIHRLAHGNIYWPYDGIRRGSGSRLRWHVHDGMKFVNQSTIADIFQRISPDVVHTNNLTGFGSQVIPLAKSQGLPVVHTLRDFGIMCSRSSVFKDLRDCPSRCLSCRILTSRKVASASEVDLVVGNSSYMVERHRELGVFRDVPSRVIYNAVPGILDNRPVASPAPGDPAYHLGFAGAIKPEKGIEVLLRALRSLGRSDWKLSIAGNGDQEYIRGLKSTYSDLPIEWLGFVPVDPFLDSIDMMVIPSIWPEPMPRTLIEAMAHRLPAVVSDAGGSPEVAAMYPGAQVYPRQDADALAEILSAAISQRPPRQNVDTGILETFSVNRLVENYLSAYREAIALWRGKA